VGRRLLAVAAVALALCGVASAAAIRGTTDPLEPQEWWLADVGANLAQAPGPGIPITIVDSGTDSTHPEFANRPNTTYPNAQTVFGPAEFHGTIVASVAAAPQNGVGMAGVYPNAVLQSFDASPDPSRGISDFAAATGIESAHCPGVINLSFGSTNPDPLLHSAILAAVHNGCLVVAAAGNAGESGSPTTFPASWPHVFTVAASDRNDAVASFSTASPGIDVAAPGVEITGAVPLSRDPSGYQSGLSGTSFSAPIVTAAAAWVWTLRPTLTAGQLADVLRAGAKDIATPGFDIASGWGLLNIPAAIAAPTPPLDPGEPNDDIDQIKPGRLFQVGEPALTTQAKPSTRIAASLDSSEDPRDLYRIWVPARKTVHVKVGGGSAAARIWGPQTLSIDESLSARRRDLRGPSIRAGAKGFAAYVEVLLTGRSGDARYVLSVTAAKR
jgi:subtilisin family serine protease